MTAVTVLAAGSGLAFVFYGVLCLASPSMQAEFVRFGLERFRVTTGVLEVLAGVGLLVGLRWSPALWLSSGGVALLMLGVVVMRVALGDRLGAIAPALILFVVNGYLFWRSLTAA
ncbi:MAG: DoxX family protein [Acidobacteria bacterium]|nr:DoxX family protein [Acidobacteriota bacterium]